MTSADLVGGLLAGLLSIFLWELVRSRHRVAELKEKFGGIAGTYEARRKLGHGPASGKLDEQIEIAVDGRVLLARSVGIEDSYSGKIAMSDELPGRGAGHYAHANRDGWGFWDLQVKDADTLLVHSTYSVDQQMVYEGFVWERLPTI